jgi:hypothetical protein
MVALDPSARADTVHRLLEGTRTHCVVEPCDGKWFPASISVRWSPSHGCPVHTVVRVGLLAAEPAAFFAAGQPFTVWADAIVDDQTVRGEGRLGDGVIVSHESAAGEIPRTQTRPAARIPSDGAAAAPGVCASPIGGRQLPTATRALAG